MAGQAELLMQEDFEAIMQANIACFFIAVSTI